MTPKHGERKAVVDDSNNQQVNWGSTELPLSAIHGERDVIWVEAQQPSAERGAPTRVSSEKPSCASLIALTGDADVEDITEAGEVDRALIEQREDEPGEKAQGARVERELGFEGLAEFEYSSHGGVVVDPPLYISYCARRSTRLLSGTQV